MKTLSKILLPAAALTLLCATHEPPKPSKPSSPTAAHLVEAPADAVAVGAATANVTGPGLFGMRWNPCKPITYRVNARGGYAGSVADVRRAFARVSAVTGVPFVYRGTTSRIAFRTNPDPRADITVSWATPAQVPQLRGAVAGLASTTYVVHGERGVRENVRGQIALDRTASLRRGFTTSGPATWGQVYLHEIGHVMGLDHVGQRTQVMYPSVGAANHRYGAGDLRRLRAVGRAAGCIRSSVR